MSIANAINSFEGITLPEMDCVKLMNRTDRKYWFNAEYLEELLLSVRDDYYILEIDGERNQPYATTYYDTPEDAMYLNHHRGKLNRFKIRRRQYVATSDSFLEIKFKTNKGRTIKTRIASEYQTASFDKEAESFIGDKSPYQTSDLHPVLSNGFKRLMLVSKSKNERCTIDQELAFVSHGVEVRLEQLVVVEVKGDARAKSPIIEAMRTRRIKPSGFSKYCMGRSLTDNSLRHGRFKLKHRQIEKEIHNTINNITKPIQI
ncbi:MAG: polyphosphate polymerase domain-containing protein [Rikenellaceae bacterium]